MQQAKTGTAETAGSPGGVLVVFPDCLSSGEPEGVTLTCWNKVHLQGLADLADHRTLVVAPWYPAIGSKYRWFPMNLAMVWSQYLSQGGSIVVLIPGSRCAVAADQLDGVDFPAGRKPTDAEELRRACLRILRARASVVPVETERILWSMEALPGPAEGLHGDPDAPLAEPVTTGLLSYLSDHPPEMTLQSVPGPSSAQPLVPLVRDSAGIPVAWYRTVGRGRLLVVPFNGDRLTTEQLAWLDAAAHAVVRPRAAVEEKALARAAGAGAAGGSVAASQNGPVAVPQSGPVAVPQSGPVAVPASSAAPPEPPSIEEEVAPVPPAEPEAPVEASKEPAPAAPRRSWWSRWVAFLGRRKRG